MLSEDFDMLGVSEGGFPIAALISTIAVGVIIYILCSRGIVKGETEAIDSSDKTIENATESK